MLIVVIGWVFFRASDLTAALAYLKCMVPVLNRAGNALMTRFYYREYVLLFIAAAVASTPVVKRLSEENWLKKEKNILAPIACIILLAISVATLSVTTYNPFIYFNF